MAQVSVGSRGGHRETGFGLSPIQPVLHQRQERVGVHLHHGWRSATAMSSTTDFGPQLYGSVRRDAQFDGFARVFFGQTARCGSDFGCDGRIDIPHIRRLSCCL